MTEKLHHVMRSRTAEFVVVGNEFLNGTSVDTNSIWLAKRLAKLGFVVRRKITVPDDLREISSAFKLALKREPVWVFSLGGLGPTFDDKTTEGLAHALRKKMKLNPLAVTMLKQSYKRRPEDLGVPKGTRRRLTKTSIKMAYMPIGASPLKNSIGSAPAILCIHEPSQIVALPGVPKEMKTIFVEKVDPLIKKGIPRFKKSDLWMKVVGVGEPRISPFITKIMRKYSPEVYIKSHATGFKEGKSVLKIQLIMLTQVKYSAQALGKLKSASNEMRNVALKLGGKVELLGGRGRV